jgi:pimeloyl-ACP methyl ester carboxylesterase
MPTPALLSMLAALLLCICDFVLAQPEPAPAISEDQRMLPYAEPGQLVDIGGRRINLQCMGTNGPTVMLMSGIFSWSLIWYKTQSVIAQKARVCAFDRANYGFSDPTPRPEILSEVVDDLHKALQAGSIALEPSGSEFKDCSATLPSETPATLRKVWPQFFTGYYFADKVSLMSSLYTHRYDSADHRSLGSMPLVVLSAENSWGTENANTPAIIRFNRTYLKTWIAMHEALAHLSSRGIHRVIKGSGHQIQLDKPQAVIDAVDEVLRQLHAGAKP